MSDLSTDMTMAQVQRLLDDLRLGNRQAVASLMRVSQARLQQLARRILSDIPHVRAWEETDDLLQNASVRLWRALASHSPATPLDFFRLAAAITRRELIDLSRHYFGPLGRATRQHLVGHDSSSKDLSPLAFQADDTNDPAKLSRWADFHEYVEQLADDERALFDLLWYEDLSLDEAAEALKTSARTVRRRWREARLKLHRVLMEDIPASQGRATAHEPH